MSESFPESQENGPLTALAEKWQDRKSKRTTQEHKRGVGVKGIKWQPADSRQGGGIRHPQPSFGVPQQRKKTIYRENLAGCQSKQNEDQHHLPLKITSLTLNSFTVPGCKMSGLKSTLSHTHMPANSISSSPITNLLLILCILIEILALANAKMKTKRLTDFTFHICIGCF